jgi:hypothetical protein
MESDHEDRQQGRAAGRWTEETRAMSRSIE